MRKNPWLTLMALLFVFGTLVVFLFGSSAISLFGSSQMRVTAKNTILHLQLEGIILNGKKFLRQLDKYAEDPHIKAIVIEINSPGGVVGPSQEIYASIKRVREDFKKPIVAVSNGLLASGAYYSAVAADKIIVAPGALVGSIGVIMEFTNLEKLYDWAKIKRYSLTTGKYKDSGAEYRAMREDEKNLFQGMINDVWEQFKDAVAEGRALKPEIVEQYADGRVLTGQQAVDLGFADDTGTIEDAIQTAAEMAKLGKDFDVFEPPKRRPGLLEMFSNDDPDGDAKWSKNIDGILDRVLRTELSNRPLYLMPGFFK